MPARRPGGSAAAWLALAAAVILLVVAGLDDWKLRSQRDDLFGRTADLSQRLTAAQKELSAAQVEKARQELYSRVLESDDVKVLFLGGKDPQPSARAKVFWLEKAKRGVVVAGNLAALPPDKQYELWVFDKGKPVAGRRVRCRCLRPCPLRVGRPVRDLRGSELRRDDRAQGRRPGADRPDRPDRVLTESFRRTRGVAAS